MNTIGEIIQRVQSAYSKGVQSDDTRLSPRHIYHKMVSVRSRLTYQKANKKQKLSQWTYQVIPCLELVLAPIHECPCLPPVGCKVYKSKYPLPKPVSALDKHLIQYVTSLDGQTIYSEVEWKDYKYKKGNRYTSHKPDFFIKDNYIYITSNKGPKLVVVSGVFEDPLEVYNYQSFCNENCTDCIDCESIFDKIFPIDGDLIEVLIEFCVQELVILFSQVIQDNTNNSKDDNQAIPNE